MCFLSFVSIPAKTFPVSKSYTSPMAFTATTAPTLSSPSWTAYIPRPEFIIRSSSQNFPTVAPVPAPTFPCFGSLSSAFSQAFLAMALSGFILSDTNIKSKMQDSHTRGTRISPRANPIPFSARYSITPPAASRPKALPPLRRTACITSAEAAGLRSSVSLEAGPPPLTSTPAGIPFSHIITVQPVAYSVFSALPILIFSISFMGISLNGYFMAFSFILLS